MKFRVTYYYFDGHNTDNQYSLDFSNPLTAIKKYFSYKMWGAYKIGFRVVR